MQPARLDLPIVPGATNRKPLWLLQPEFAYRPITEIQKTAPLRLTVPGHGLPAEWPVWFEGVAGWSALNRDKLREMFRMAAPVDTDTIELNELNGTGQKAAGGMLVYRQPVDLAGVTGRLVITAADAEVLDLTTENGGLEIAGLGQLIVVLSAEQSGAITWSHGTYTLDLTMSNGDVMRWLAGEVVVGNGSTCHAGCA